MAILGIDGDKWYVCNENACLGDPWQSFVFADTPKEAFAEWHQRHPQERENTLKFTEFWEMTVAEYKEFRKD